MPQTNETVRSLRILQAEKDKIDREIAALQERSRAYDLAIKAVEAEARRPVDPVATPVRDQNTPAESILELFSAAVKDKAGAKPPRPRTRRSG